MKIGLIILAVLVVLGIGVGGCVALTANEVVKEIDKSTGPAAAEDFDLTVKSCQADDILGPQAKGTITNTSKKAQGFEIEVRFETPDGVLISEDSTFTDAMKVGQSTEWTITSLKSTDATEVECSTPKVSYTIFDNEDGN